MSLTPRRTGTVKRPSCFRCHHLIKTFFAGWHERQLPNGALILTSPNGRTYTITPTGALFFPQLAILTGELALPTASPPPTPRVGWRCRPENARAQDRAARIEWERGLNRARYEADPPPFGLWDRSAQIIAEASADPWPARPTRIPRSSRFRRPAVR
jgi:hypothetical protein